MTESLSEQSEGAERQIARRRLLQIGIRNNDRELSLFVLREVLDEFGDAGYRVFDRMLKASGFLETDMNENGKGPVAQW